MFSWFSKMTLEAKLVIAFTCVSFFVIVVGGTSYFFGQKTVDQYRKIALKNLPSSLIATTLRGTAKDFRATVFRMSLADASQEELLILSDRLVELGDQYAEAEREYSMLSFVDGEEELFKRTAEKWRQWVAVAHKMSEVRRQNKGEGLVKFSAMLRTEFRAGTNQYNEAVNALVRFHQRTARLNREAAESAEKTGHYFIGAAIFCCFVFALSIGLFCGRQISNILNQISSQLGGVVRQVGASSTEINQISQVLSSAAQEQASSLQETSSAITEITSTIERSSEGAERSQQEIRRAQADVERGQSAIENLVQGVEMLRGTSHKMVSLVEQNNKGMDSLVGVIREIGNKTNVINEIVFQTKLLSFNASVEAARAGDAGKGFSVVAEEVGNLARMSGTSASEITAMLASGIQRVEGIAADSKSLLSVVGAEVATHLEGVLDRIHACENSFRGISEGTSGVVQNMSQICAATSEQTVGIKEISSAMNQLTEATNTNAVSAEKVAAAATNLEGEVAHLEASIAGLQVIVSGRA